MAIVGNWMRSQLMAGSGGAETQSTKPKLYAKLERKGSLYSPGVAVRPFITDHASLAATAVMSALF